MFFFLPQMQKLEPWLVSKVKVAGGLNLLSGLAKGLPVSEDHDVVTDVEHLKAPSIPKKRLLMLVGVFSTGNNFERRMALRRSWMQYEAVRSGDVAVRFFIGLVSDQIYFYYSNERNILFCKSQNKILLFLRTLYYSKCLLLKQKVIEMKIFI